MSALFLPAEQEGKAMGDRSNKRVEVYLFGVNRLIPGKGDAAVRDGTSLSVLDYYIRI